MNTQFDKLKAIFLVAVEKESPAERLAYLDEACGGNPLMRERLEALLDADALSGAVLDCPPHPIDPTAPYEPILEQPGVVIGPYKLLQKIGEGGMGLVFMAEQQRPVKRKVALKIIKPGMDSRQVVARFEAERQALALMNHPHIAQVFDAGETESGRPYFVMELVRGVAITEYCDQNNLTPRERLELFIPVCHAVQHAHQKGVIHRDIKPTNVLVTLHDGRPVPKVIDFGVSKAIHQELTERTLFTNFAQMVGTPLYMSPEQAEMSGLDIDTRADIYSLGVLLYELLTGQTPFDKTRLRGAAFDEIRRIIREEEPLRPSTRLSTLGAALTAVSSHRKTDPRRLSQLVRGDLDWIVMRSLEKDRTRRYGTASEFAADIERHLNDEPVAAGPPSLVYRMRKFSRKHRASVAAVSAVIVTLALGLTASLLLYAQSERLRSEGDIARLDADDARAAESRRADELDQALDKVTAEQNLKNAALEAKDAALNRSEALRLTTLSTNVLPRNPGLSLLLATEAARRGPRLAPINNALVAALAECREVRTLVARPPLSDHEPAPLAVHAVSYNHNGSRVVTVSAGAIHRRVTVRTKTDLFGEFQGPETLSSKLRIDVGTIHVWKAATGRLLNTIQAPPNQRFDKVEVSPNGHVLAATFAGSTLVKYAGGETHLYTGRVVRLYDVESGSELHTLRGHSDHIASITFSPDSRRLLTASHDKTARLWDVSTGEPVPEFLLKSMATIDSAEFSPDGRHVLTLSRGIDQGRNYVDHASRDEPDREHWKIDPPARDRVDVRDLRTGEYGNWSRSGSMTVSLPGVGSVELIGRPGVRLWDAASGARIPDLPAESSPEKHEVEMAVVARFSPEGKRIAIGGSKGTVVLRTVDPFRESLQFSPRNGTAIRSLEFSPDGRRLLVCYEDDRIAVCDSESGASLFPSATDAVAKTMPHVRSAHFSADGRRVFVCRAGELTDRPSADADARTSESTIGNVAILDADTLQEVGQFRGHGGEVTASRLSPDGRYLATASLDGTARLWDVQGPAPVGRVISVERAADAPTLNQDGRLVCAANLDAFRRGEREELARIIDVASGETVSRLVPDRSKDSQFFKEGLGRLLVVQFSPDGKRLLTVSADRHVRIIRPGTPADKLFATETSQWPISEELPYTPVRVWDVTTGRELFHAAGLRTTVDWGSFSPDGRHLLTLSNTRESTCYVQPERGDVISSGLDPVAEPGALIHVWDANDGRLLATLRDVLNTTSDWDGSLTWMPAGGAFASSRLFGWIDPPKQRLTVVPGIWSQDVLLFSPSGKHLLTRNSDEARLIDISETNGPGRDQEQYELANFGPNGEKTKSPLRRSDVFAREVPLAGPTSSLVSAAFSGDGSRLAAATAESAIQVWAVSTGTLQHTLRGHSRPAAYLAFSPDGRWLLSTSEDRTARIWNVETGIEFLTLSGHRGPVRSGLFTPDSQTVIVSSADGTVRSLPLDPLPVALTRLPRELTPEERAQYEVGE